MQYEYTIYFAPEQSTTFVTEEPLPHIIVGNVLRLETHDLSQDLSRPEPVIERIEVYVFAPDKAKPPKSVHMTIFLSGSREN